MSGLNGGVFADKKLSVRHTVGQGTLCWPVPRASHPRSPVGLISVVAHGIGGPAIVVGD